MAETRKQDAAAFEEGPITPTRIGLVAGMMDVVVFAAVGYIALEDVATGGISGLLVGIGVFLFLPLFMAVDEDGEFSELAPATDGTPLREFHRLAGGFGFSAAGMVLLATGFAELELLVGLPAALLAGVVVYLGAGFVMPNAQLPQ
ncbi:hypothetical protein [Halobiforma nitratireducens]|uniref:Uncharacterized protein n=1 Tax=Halobiforma nitratireducens JCM 10879 TaxID=1227454 RepID=M0M790_9EURY|nr:hypothetical protein [Halobiforma nitratireducens]EMA41682.1 hypothetical protein C446_05185 [Halobiforma nitratireducens JCM 10879]